MITRAPTALHCLLLVSLTFPFVIAGAVAVDDGAAHGLVADQQGDQGVRPDPVYSRTWLEERPFHISTICARKGGDAHCSIGEGRDGKKGLILNRASVTCELGFSMTRPAFCHEAATNLLAVVSALLEYAGVGYWLEQGTLLGAMRNGHLIPWTNDIDIGALQTDFPRIVELLNVGGFSKRSSLPSDGCQWGSLEYMVHSDPVDTSKQWFSIHAGVAGQHLDINGRTILRAENAGDTDSVLDQQAIIPELCNQNLFPCVEGGGAASGFVTFEEMFPLTNIKLNDLMFWAPHNPAAVLAKEYGDLWETPDRYGTGAWSDDDSIHRVHIDAAAAAVAVGAGGGTALLAKEPRSLTVTAASNTSRWHKRPRVYVDIVGDLLHFGHARLFERARRMGRTLVVGVHSDDTVASYKRWPILTMEERIESVRSCRWVDEIIPNAPLVVTAEYMEEHGIDLVVHGDDQLPEASRASYGAAMDQGKFKTVPYTAEISTSGIIRRVLDRGDELRTKKEVNRFSESGASPLPPPV